MNQIEQRRQELEKGINSDKSNYYLNYLDGFNEALELVGREELKECNFSNNCLACKSRKYKLKQILSSQTKQGIGLPEINSLQRTIGCSNVSPDKTADISEQGITSGSKSLKRNQHANLDKARGEKE